MEIQEVNTYYSITNGQCPFALNILPCNIKIKKVKLSIV